MLFYISNYVIYETRDHNNEILFEYFWKIRVIINPFYWIFMFVYYFLFFIISTFIFIFFFIWNIKLFEDIFYLNSRTTILTECEFSIYWIILNFFACILIPQFSQNIILFFLDFSLIKGKLYSFKKPKSFFFVNAICLFLFK